MKVLIAEDDHHIREGLCVLAESEGYVPLPAADGERALQIFHAERPQLLLLDIMMPRRDGYAVCREVRRIDTEVPVIFISAKSQEIDRVVGLELGADDYIVKPFGTREVVARIRAVTRRSLARRAAQEPGSEEIVLDDLHVMPDQLRARRGDQTIELSLRDVRILQYLHGQRGKAVHRDSLFNACWGRDYFANSRTLDQHISKLRKLVETDAKNPRIIRTVHGVGYRYD